MLKHFANYIPEELNDISGSVFYSGENAFTGKKHLYILGLNPGGSAISQKDETIFRHTNKVLNFKSPNFSEYKDSEWRGKKAGTYGMQPRVLHLLKNIGVDPYNVPASNICFVRSSRESNIKNELSNYIDLCWSFHQNVIDKLQIKSILCFGKTVGKHVRKRLQADIFVEEFTEDNNRKWKTQVYKNYKNQIIIVATHPSIVDWTNKKTDISELVKKYVKN